MKIEQIYTGCLAAAAYYIESNGEALVIDPLRETAPYIERLKKDNVKLKYILETHFHADFVSGHVDLARKTGAVIVFGPTAQTAYPAQIAEDGEMLEIGALAIKVLHTPGHTPESVTYLLQDANGKDYAVFTGDTLFIGDVGRPDLVQKLNAAITPDYLAGLLYDSLRNKLLPLADDVIVYPGHGAGSACGKNIARETMATLGQQKQFNYALRMDMTKVEFIQQVTTGLVEPPQYFPFNARMNRNGNISTVEELIRTGTTALLPAGLRLLQQKGALVIDTRSNVDFTAAFIPGSVFIGLDDSFATWVGTLVTDLEQPIILVTDPGREKEAVTRLARVGYDNAIGYLEGGMAAWRSAGFAAETIREMEAYEFADHHARDKSIQILDVRRESEYRSRHVSGASNFPLDFINRDITSLAKEGEYYIHCAGGYRSVIAASMLQAKGYDVVNIKGGFAAMRGTLLKLTEYRVQETML